MSTEIPPNNDYLNDTVADVEVSEELSKDYDKDNCNFEEDVETDMRGICDMLKLCLMAAKEKWRCYDELVTLKELMEKSYMFIDESHKNIMKKMESFQMQVEFTKKSVKQHNLAREEVLGMRRRKEE